MKNNQYAKDLKMGESIQFANMVWSKFAEDHNRNAYMLADLYSHTMNFGEDNNWKDSPIRYKLHKLYEKNIKEFGDGSIITIQTDLFGHDGTRNYEKCEDKISLLTYNLYRNNRDCIKKWGISYWLLTPESTIYDYADNVMCVIPDGRISSCMCCYGNLAVRPFFILKHDTKLKEEYNVNRK